LRSLWSQKLFGLADSLWHCTRLRNAVVTQQEREEVPEELRNNACALPSSLEAVISRETGSFHLRLRPFVESEQDYDRFFELEFGLDSQGSWIIRRVIEDGMLWSGFSVSRNTDAVDVDRPCCFFDCDEAGLVLTAHCDLHGSVPRGPMARQAISWGVRSAGESCGQGEIMEGTRMMKGIWKRSRKDAERFVLK